MRSVAVSLLVLAACPAKQPETPQPQPVAGVGCPKASDIYLAQYMRPDTYSTEPAGQGAASTPAQGAPGYTGWTLPLFNTKDAPPEGTPAFQTLDAQAAASIGIPQPPPAVWIMLQSGLCKATPGSFYAQTVPSNPPNRTYGVALSGCGEPQEGDGEISIALVSVEPPSQCVPVSPQQAAARMGTEGQNGAWTPPAPKDRGTTIPPPIADQLVARGCKDASCEMLWSIGKVDVNNKTVAYAGAVNWAYKQGSADPCAWKFDTFSGVFVVEPSGAATLLSPPGGRPLSLAVALADRTGARALILDGIGEYATYDVGAGPATLGRHLVWFSDNPEAYAATDHLGPSNCAQK
jgi:hypothetical protein